MANGVDRRAFLKGAAASAAVVGPSPMPAQKPASRPEPPARRTTASASGLSTRGLNRMHGVISGYVDRGEAPGMVTTKRTDISGNMGSFGWNGGLGIAWYADPKDGLTMILLTQRAWTSSSPPNICLDFWTSAALAVED